LPPSPSSTLFPYTTLFRSALIMFDLVGHTHFFEQPEHPQGAGVLQVMYNDHRYPPVTTSNDRSIRPLQHSTAVAVEVMLLGVRVDRKSTRLNSSHVSISYA